MTSKLKVSKNFKSLKSEIGFIQKKWFESTFDWFGGASRRIGSIPGIERRIFFNLNSFEVLLAAPSEHTQLPFYEHQREDLLCAKWVEIYQVQPFSS